MRVKRIWRPPCGSEQDGHGELLRGLDDGHVRFTAADLKRPFELLLTSNFDEEIHCAAPVFSGIRCRRKTAWVSCSRFAVSKNDSDRGFAGGTDAHRLRNRSHLNRRRNGYLYGCRPEADALVAKSYEMLTLADATDEKSAGDYGPSGAGPSITLPWPTSLAQDGRGKPAVTPSPRLERHSWPTIGRRRNTSIASTRILKRRNCSTLRYISMIISPWRTGSPPTRTGVPRHPAASSAMRSGSPRPGTQPNETV